MKRVIPLVERSRASVAWRIAVLAGAVALIAALGLLVGVDGVALPDWQSRVGRAILSLRLSRLATGLVVGGALAAAGVVFQGVLRNPLADPYVLGISGGGALGAALAIVLGWHLRHSLFLPGGAFVLAAVTLVLVYMLASYDGVPSIYGLILSGVIVSAMASSLLMLILSLATMEGLHSITWWTLGNLQGGSSTLLASCGGAIGAAVVVIFWMARDLDVLTLGRGAAHNMGVTGRTMVILLSAATLAAAAAVALAGLIGFVGLVVPHAMRQWLGAGHRRLLTGSILAGGGLLVLCDCVARLVLAPRELPVGVITALIGGPFFLVLLRRRRQSWRVE